MVTEGNVSDQASSHFVYSTNEEIGEIDTTEDAIDGMGAIQFTDEEDCGYFGQLFLASLARPTPEIID